MIPILYAWGSKKPADCFKFESNKSREREELLV